MKKSPNHLITKSPNRSWRTRYRVNRDTLVIDLGVRRRVLSSAPRGGGIVRAQFLLNHQVLANPRVMANSRPPRTWGDPSRDLGKLAVRLGIDRRCVGLMTAVSLRHIVTVREVRGNLWVEGFVTVGVTNAVKAGEPISRPRQERRDSPGTINIILVTNARLSVSAMVGAVQVATEAKTGTLLEAGVPSYTGRRGATGTGTDAVVLACGDGPFLRYSGTHTEIGGMLARVVSRGVAKGLRRSELWKKQRH